MLHALHGFDLDLGFFVAREVDIGKHHEILRAVGDVEGAIEAELLHAALLASGLVEGVRERDCAVVKLIGKVRGKDGDCQRNGRFNPHAQFLTVVVGSHQAVDLGRGRDVVFLVHDASPVELGQDAVVHAIPGVILDADVVRRNELANAGSEDGSNGRDDGPFGPALIAEGDDHRALGRQMTFVDRVNDVLLNADETEIQWRLGVLHGVVPRIGPYHGDSHRIAGFDLDMHIAAAGCGTVRASRMNACGLHRDGFVVGRSPVENAIVLAECECGAGVKQRGKYAEFSHTTSIGGGRGRDPAN